MYKNPLSNEEMSLPLDDHAGSIKSTVFIWSRSWHSVIVTAYSTQSIILRELNLWGKTNWLIFFSFLGHISNVACSKPSFLHSCQACCSSNVWGFCSFSNRNSSSIEYLNIIWLITKLYLVCFLYYCIYKTIFTLLFRKFQLLFQSSE